MIHFHEELKVISSGPYFGANYVPASSAQVHASNLLQLPNGDVLCAWFGGSEEALSDVYIYLSRLQKGAHSWSEPCTISDDANQSEQNPVLFLNPETEDLWMIYTAQPSGNRSQAIVRFRTSKDEGATWSKAENLFDDEGLFIRQPLVVLKDGTWILPAWYCRTPPGERCIGNDDISVVKYTHDSGRTWHEQIVPNSTGAVHMNIKALADGTFIAFYRSRWADNIYVSVSQDGIDWSAPKSTDLPNPNSGICFDVLSDGRLIIVYNDSAFQAGQGTQEGLFGDITPKDDNRTDHSAQPKEAIWGVPRRTLTVGISSDAGNNWRTKVLQEGNGFCMTHNSSTHANRELSNPSMCIDGEVVNVALTFWRRRIKFCRFEVGWVDT
jgi:predicted neuraminidase